MARCRAVLLDSESGQLTMPTTDHPTLMVIMIRFTLLHFQSFLKNVNARTWKMLMVYAQIVNNFLPLALTFSLSQMGMVPRAVRKIPIIC